ncbi:hypothetical protein DFJ73DRAFT_487487 [Zopfochytrium polystomum]|nr:hypothetical protein DFJ73DRAFT_487487 [Zopfochytrium polystomum]
MMPCQLNWVVFENYFTLHSIKVGQPSRPIVPSHPIPHHPATGGSCLSAAASGCRGRICRKSICSLWRWISFANFVAVVSWILGIAHWSDRGWESHRKQQELRIDWIKYRQGKFKPRTIASTSSAASCHSISFDLKVATQRSDLFLPSISHL